MPYCKKEKIIFIHVPKTGGTTLEHLFNMQHEDKLFYPKDIYTYDECLFSPQHLPYRIIKEKNMIEDIGDYKKIIIFRNPYKRALSSYFHHKKSRKFNPKKFHSFVVKNFISPRKDHFLPQSTYLDTEFDYIARTETLDDDIGRMNKLFNLGLVYKKTRSNKSNNKDEYLERILPETYKLMNVIFNKDFELLGYKKNTGLSKEFNVAMLSHGLIGRSISHTIDSFRENVLSPLNDIGNVDIFYHSWHTDKITNKYSREKNVDIDSNIIKELLPDAQGVIEDQDEWDNSINWEKHRENNPFAGSVNIPSERETMNTLKNHKRAIISQKRSYDFFEENKKKKYDLVIVARLDVRYPEKIRVPEIKEIKKSTEEGKKVIWVPDFDHFKGLNDRFAAGGEEAIKMWSNRVEFSDQWTLNHNEEESSEWLMKKFIDKNNYETRYLKFVFQRVRAGGEIDKADKLFLKNYYWNKLTYLFKNIYGLLYKIKIFIRDKILK